MARSVGIDRERVIATAGELADQHGFDGLTLAMVASQLGVRLPSLYNHVDGLGGLRRGLALRSVRQLTAEMRRAAVGVAGEEAVVALATSYRAFALRHPGQYAATVRAPAGDDAELQQASQELVELVLAALRAYGLGEQEGIHAVRGLRSLIHGFTAIELGGGFGLSLDRDESFARLLRAFVAGLPEAYQGRT